MEETIKALEDLNWKQTMRRVDNSDDYIVEVYELDQRSNKSKYTAELMQINGNKYFTIYSMDFSNSISSARLKMEELKAFYDRLEKI